MGKYNMTQFKLTDVIGQAMNPNQNTIQAQIDSAQGTTPAYAGDAVAFGTTTGSMPTVNITTLGSGIGVILYNPKADKFTSGMMVTVGLKGSIVNMRAGGAITRGAVVEYNITSGDVGTVQVPAGGRTKGIGICIDKATAINDVVRVLLDPAIVAY
jgi:hypothetical protein